MHFLYDKLLGVMFWDYSGTHMDLNRRVCVPFAVIWGPLTAFALRQVQPLLHPIALHAPAGAGLALLLVLTADSFFTVRLLRRTHNVDLLGLPNLLAVQPGPDVAVHRVPHGGLVENLMPQAGIQLQGHVPDPRPLEGIVGPPDTGPHIAHRVVLPGNQQDGGVFVHPVDVPGRLVEPQAPQYLA